MILRKIYYFLNPTQRRLLRRIYYLPIDLFDIAFHKRSKLVPPKGLIFTGRGDFILIGNNFLNHFITLSELKPDDIILDIGCGIGRIARPLAGFINPQGAYFGFDVVEKGIDWCKKSYAAYSNFHFKYAPLKNDLYNLSANGEAMDFDFPYNDEMFDLIIAISVFTHVQERVVKRYFFEIARTMKKGKNCFCTFFLMTKEREEYLQKSKQPFFKHKFENHYLHNLKVKDANIAYQYQFIEKIINDAGMKIKNFYPGYWAQKENACLSYQDMLIITK